MLGGLWLIDAGLQYQPYMFGRDFVTNTIETTASGAPFFVAHPTLWAAHVMIDHIAVYNVFFATIQVVIALAIFYRPTVKLGLALSVVWSLGVWWLAEGIGRVTNGASPFRGAPGPVILCLPGGAVVALDQADQSPLRAPRGVVGRTWSLGAVVPKLAWPCCG